MTQRVEGSLVNSVVHRTHVDLEKPLAITQSAANRGWYLSLAVLFSASLSITTWFNFVFPHPEVSALGDASGYVQDGRMLLNLIPAWHQITTFSLHNVIDLANAIHFFWNLLNNTPSLSLNGPVFPAVVACFLWLNGVQTGTPSLVPSDWFLPVTMQCCFAAINCVLTAVVGARLWDRKVGLLAGVCMTFYPGFIVNTSRPTTEIFGSTLLLVVVLLSTVIAKSTQSLSCMLLGAVLTMLQLTRSLMVLAWLVVPLTTLWGARRQSLLLCCAGLIFGSALILTPWMTWQQVRTGHASILLDRVGAYNLYVGNDVQGQAWLTMPRAVPAWAYTSSSPRVVWRIFKEDPRGWFKLLLDKPSRMFKTPWNDMRQTIGPFTLEAQVLFHQIIVALSLIGLAVCVLTSQKSLLIPRLVLCEFLAIHAVYCLFAPIPRYNLSAMPEIVLLASAAAIALVRSNLRWQSACVWASLCVLALAFRVQDLVYVSGTLITFPQSLVSTVESGLKLAGMAAVLYAVLSWTRAARYPQLSKPIIWIVFLAITPFTCLPSRNFGRVEERVLSTNSPISRTVLIPPAHAKELPNTPCYLAIDADNADYLNNGVDIFVNGHRLNAPVISGIAMAESDVRAEIPPLYHYRGLMFACLAGAANRDQIDLRQWFFIPLAKDVVAETSRFGKFEVCVKPKNNRFSGRLYGAVQKGRGRFQLPSMSTYSFDKCFYGSESDRDFTDSRLDSSIPSPSALGTRGLVPNIFLVADPKRGVADYSQRTLISKRLPDVSLPLGRPESREFRIRSFPNPSPERSLLMRVSGRAQADNETRPGMEFSILFDDTKQPSFFTSRALPTALKLEDGSSHFDMAVPLAPAAFENRKFKEATLRFFSQSPLDAAWNVPRSASSDVRFTDLVFEVVEIRGNPTLEHCQIY